MVELHKNFLKYNNYEEIFYLDPDWVNYIKWPKYNNWEFYLDLEMVELHKNFLKYNNKEYKRILPGLWDTDRMKKGDLKLITLWEYNLYWYIVRVYLYDIIVSEIFAWYTICICTTISLHICVIPGSWFPDRPTCISVPPMPLKIRLSSATLIWGSWQCIFV